MVDDEKKSIDEIIKQRSLPYSVEVLDIQGDRITVRNNFGNTIVYIKKGEDYLLESEL